MKNMYTYANELYLGNPSTETNYFFKLIWHNALLILMGDIIILMWLSWLQKQSQLSVRLS